MLLLMLQGSLLLDIFGAWNPQQPSTVSGQKELFCARSLSNRQGSVYYHIQQVCLANPGENSWWLMHSPNSCPVTVHICTFGWRGAVYSGFSILISPASMPFKRPSLAAIHINRVDLSLPQICLLQDKRSVIRNTEKVSVAWQRKFFSLWIITKLLKIKLFFICNELCMSSTAVKISKVVLRANAAHKYQLVFVIFS